jgi:Rieske Fe-S protein
MADNDRRSFLNHSWKVLGALVAAEMVWGSWDMLKPAEAGAFGGALKVGDPHDFPEGSVRYFPEGRLYVTSFEGKLSALYQKCPHLGCKVPFCTTSNQFECPCHGSVYNIKGEYLDGPAPRGMDRFPLRIENDQVVVDTGTLVEGPQQGILTGPGASTGASCNGTYPPLPDLSGHSHGAAPADHAHSAEASPQAPAEHSHETPAATPSPSDSHGGMDMGGMDMGGMDMGGMDMGGN